MDNVLDKKIVKIKLDLLLKLDSGQKNALEKAAERYGRFFGMNVCIANFL